MDGQTRDLCEGIALGVNAWLYENPDKAPPWTEGVQPWDVLALLHSYLTSMAPFDLPNVYAPPKGTPSANAWAVAPELSESGEAMLIINPHMNYSSIYRWYETHLSIAEWDVAGATLYGLPVVLQGHNGALGWALAPNEPDIGDIFVEPDVPIYERNPQNSLAQQESAEQAMNYLYAAATTVPYYVLTQDGFEERLIHRIPTKHGPVVATVEGRNLSYQVGGYGEFGALKQLLDMGRAQDLEEFRAALEMHQLPSFHIVYADNEGNIFYLYNAKTGDRSTALTPDSTPPYPGWTIWDSPVSGEGVLFDWGPTIPLEELPAVLNPPSGYIQACGTPPWLATTDTVDLAPDVPDWFASDPDTYRAKRVRQLLSQGPRSFYDNQSMLFDALSPFAVDVVPYLLNLADENPEFVAQAHPDLPAALDTLSEWNFLADTDSLGMTFFHVWWSVFQWNSPATLRTNEFSYQLIEQDSSAIQQHALNSLSQAAMLMQNQFQSVNIPWGEVHTLTRGNREVAMPGALSGEPLFAQSDIDFQQNKWRITSGYGFAMAVRFGVRPEAVSLVPFGTSEDPASPHYADQLDLLAGRRFKVTRFEQEDVFRHTKRATGKGMVLVPRDTNTSFLIQAPAPVSASLAESEYMVSAMPSDLAAFTNYMEPIVDSRNIPFIIDMELEVPPGRCKDEYLSELAVFGYRTRVGWEYIPEQTYDPETGHFFARAYESQVYAVLGPAALRQDITNLAATPADPAKSRVRPGITEIARAYDENAERWLPDFLAPRVGASTPLSIPTGPAPPEPAAPAAIPDPEPSAQTEQRKLPTTPAVATPKAQEEPAPVETKETVVAANADANRANSPGPSQGGTVTWSSKSLKELRGASQNEDQPFILAPDPALASFMEIGKEFQLRPPVEGVLFHLISPNTIRGQAALAGGPPTRLPEGMATFTPVCDVLTAPSNARGLLMITLLVEQGVCEPSALGDLKIYTHDANNGWQPLAKQKTDARARRLSGTDDQFRTYVVLGPKEKRLRAQGTQEPPQPTQ
jgi:acyl-homoserine-lactone acylase